MGVWPGGMGSGGRSPSGFMVCQMLTPQDFRAGRLWVRVHVGKVTGQGGEAGRLERKQVSERADQSNVSHGSNLVSSGRRKSPNDGQVPDVGTGRATCCPSREGREETLRGRSEDLRTALRTETPTVIGI